jgi:hypothetical protein
MNVGRYLRGEDLHVGTSRITKPQELKMNERIKELKQQARDFYLLQEDLDCSIKELHELVEEKFAELLIRECASISAHFSMENKRFHPDIDPANLEVGCRMVYFSTCWAVSTEIKEHFGVE